jgi:hypothetical protein
MLVGNVDRTDTLIHLHEEAPPEPPHTFNDRKSQRDLSDWAQLRTDSVAIVILT